MAQFSRLIRFLADDGCVYYGDALLPQGTDDISKTQTAYVITGDIFGDHKVATTATKVISLLAPLAFSDIGTVRCVGLNYGGHAAETAMSRPSYPLLFYKPRTSISGPTDDIKIPQMAQASNTVDYECELVIVIGKPCRDVAESEALEAVLGYSVGNDVTHRDWQLKWGEGQWSHGKGFDTWAPFGPGIATRAVIHDPQNLKIWTKVDGEKLQDSSTGDLLFGVAKLVSLLSRGVTLMPGDIIFTGTPPGVGMCREPTRWLENGTTVEVGLEHVGVCTNKVRFQ